MGNIYTTDIVEIKKLMAENRIDTIKELSEKSGINRNTLGKILNCEIQPSSDTMERLVFTLKIPPEKAGRIFFSNNLRSA